MRGVTIIFFVLTFAGLLTTAYGQEVKVEIYYDSASAAQASSSGDKMVEYKGYNLQQVLSKVLQIPIQYVALKDTTLLKRTVSIKVVTQERISDVNLETFVVRAIKAKLGLTVTFSNREVLTYVASITNDQNLKMNKCLTDDGEVKRITQINRTWKGYCVTIDELLKKITEWSGESIINETLDKANYNLEVNDSELDSMILDLEFNYGIVITKEKRKIKFIYVQ